MITIRLQIEREINIGRQGGSLRWPVHIVVLICEIIVNGTPPSVILYNAQTTSAAITGNEVNELPSLDYVCKCRVVVQNLNKVLSDLRLGKADHWHHIFTDRNTRRQNKFQNLVIGL